jgi:hypothetical protein
MVSDFVVGGSEFVVFNCFRKADFHPKVSWLSGSGIMNY